MQMFKSYRSNCSISLCHFILFWEGFSHEVLNHLRLGQETSFRSRDRFRNLLSSGWLRGLGTSWSEESAMSAYKCHRHPLTTTWTLAHVNQVNQVKQVQVNQVKQVRVKANHGKSWTGSTGSFLVTSCHILSLSFRCTSWGTPSLA